MKRCIVISASSDIGLAVSRHWLSLGYAVSGTFRTGNADVESLRRAGAHLVHCDVSNRKSIAAACAELMTEAAPWDVLMVAPGTQEPVGLFQDCDFDAWETSITVNFTAQMRIVHTLLPVRRMGQEPGPLVLLFAGGGTNNATLNYSAYTLSKIALIKACELLDAEIPDSRFAIVGPGWVKTKIHEATLRAGEKAGTNYARTLEKLGSDTCVPMVKVIECCDWCVQAPRAVISGRNLSLVFDAWGNPEMDRLLIQDPDMYKLRRHGNDHLIRASL